MLQKELINNQIYSLLSIPNDLRKIVIYCHGFGESKDRIQEHAHLLNQNNIGIIGFDFPCHGEDKNSDHYYNLNNSLSYLKQVIDYAKKYGVPISLMGSSFGGYIILSLINKTNEYFDKVFLKFPAVNFYECTKTKLKIELNYSDNHEYYEFLNGRRMFKDAFIQFMNDNLMDNFDKHGNDIYIIHGDKDNTVLLSDIECFCLKNNIKLDIIKGAGHGMTNHLEIVNQKLIRYLCK